MKSSAFSLNKRALKIWWEISPKLILIIIAHTFFLSIKPLVPLFFTARLITSIASGESIGQVRTWVIILVFASFLVNLISAIITRIYNAEFNLIFHRLEKLYSDKFLDMDFQSVDSASTQHLMYQIAQNQNYAAYGLIISLEVAIYFTQAIFTIIGSLSLSIRLFTSTIPTGGGQLVFFNSLAFALIFLGILVGLTIISPILKTKAMSYWATEAEGAKFGNRLFGFFGFTVPRELDRSTDMRIYGQERIALHKFGLDHTFGLKGRLAKLSKGRIGILAGLGHGLTSLLMGIVFLYVGAKAWAETFGVGEVTQYVGALMALSEGVSLLISGLGEMKNNASFIETTFEFLDIENKMYQGSLTVEKRADRKYEIEVKNLSFKYPGTDDWVLRNVSMKFEIGERLAIVGANGSGKTTLIKLLCRLYDPTEGEILLNGIDIKKYDYKEYISIYSVVFQDFKLFSLPLGENIGSSSTYNRERVNQVLEEVGLELDDKYTKGLDTYLYKDLDEKGIEVSGGEAQKIAIARALYGDAPFLILDEPTASLDPIAEAEIYQHLNKIVGDKTAVFISHRLSSCRFADRIVVFDKGSVKEVGSHEDLVKDEGSKYYELWHSQAQHYV